MAVVNPVLFTEVLDTEVALSRPSQEEVLRKISQNINMLGQLAMIGAIKCFNINQSGASTPEATVYQLADGGEITETTSPLRSSGPTTRLTPNTVNRYIRGANGSTVLGNELGGAATVSLIHDHNDTTGTSTFPAVSNAGVDGYGGPITHSHIINNDLSAAEALELAHVKTAMYLKIN